LDAVIGIAIIRSPGPITTDLATNPGRAVRIPRGGLGAALHAELERTNESWFAGV